MYIKSTVKCKAYKAYTNFHTTYAVRAAVRRHEYFVGNRFVLPCLFVCVDREKMKKEGKIARALINHKLLTRTGLKVTRCRLVQTSVLVRRKSATRN